MIGSLVCTASKQDQSESFLEMDVQILRVKIYIFVRVVKFEQYDVFKKKVTFL